MSDSGRESYMNGLIIFMNRVFCGSAAEITNGAHSAIPMDHKSTKTIPDLKQEAIQSE